MTSLDELHKEIIESPGYKAQARIKTIGHYFYVFGGNYRELKRILEIPSENFLEILGEEKMEEFFREITRLLHNYVAAAKMLADHTNTLMSNWYKETEFFDMYEAERKRRFAKNDWSNLYMNSEIILCTMNYRLRQVISN